VRALNEVVLNVFLTNHDRYVEPVEDNIGRKAK